ITTRAALICTGSVAAAPPIPGLAEAGFVTNEDVFDLDNMPASLVVIGGGPTGVELGQAFHRLGSKVTILEAKPWLLPTADGEACDELFDILQCEGLTLATNAPVESVRVAEGRKVVQARIDGVQRDFHGDEILVAAGRKPNMDGLGLEAIGVEFSPKGIVVDKTMRTTVKNIYAAGDVTGGLFMTHVAATEATTAALNALAPPIRRKMSYRVVPWATFTDPEVAGVGLTEMQARQKHGRVRVVRLPWREIDRAHTDGDTRGFIKLVLAGATERLVGAHLVGRGAGELLPELAQVIRQRKGLDAIVYTIHAYPTLSIGLQQAAWRGMQTSASWGYLQKGLSPLLRVLALCLKQCEMAAREALA
ncbi:MAG: dihydrolipoyl dehydrogenase family protein, partial [Anaerolineales bacterium]